MCLVRESRSAAFSAPVYISVGAATGPCRRLHYLATAAIFGPESAGAPCLHRAITRGDEGGLAEMQELYEIELGVAG